MPIRKFQSAQLVLAILALGIVYLLNPENFQTLFNFGDVHAHISPIPWLGIKGEETWLEIALVMGFWITFATAAFMYFQIKKAGIPFKGLLAFLPWVLLFSAMNAFSEEAIFRLGIIGPLFGQLALPAVLLISGVLFGLPHYFGQPSGVIGVLMAGFLGWLLALSLVETQGLLVAWAIHFVQDVVILSSTFLINAKKA